jgi:hypothetical protein
VTVEKRRGAYFFHGDLFTFYLFLNILIFHGWQIKKHENKLIKISKNKHEWRGSALCDVMINII